MAAMLAPPSAAAVDVGVSIGINQPGVYGRIDIGRTPPPVLYPQPVIVRPGPIAMVRTPVYLYVPPGHAKRWDKHCARYGACNQPVYFVQESWIRDRYDREHARPGARDGHRGYDDDRRGHRDDHPGKGRGRGPKDRD